MPELQPFVSALQALTGEELEQIEDYCSELNYQTGLVICARLTEHHDPVEHMSPPKDFVMLATGFVLIHPGFLKEHWYSQNHLRNHQRHCNRNHHERRVNEERREAEKTCI